MDLLKKKKRAVASDPKGGTRRMSKPGEHNYCMYARRGTGASEPSGASRWGAIPACIALCHEHAVQKQKEKEKRITGNVFFASFVQQKSVGELIKKNTPAPRIALC